jgi:hypothetical protein
VHKRVILTGKGVEFVIHNIKKLLVAYHALTEDKIDDVKGDFYEKLKYVFDKSTIRNENFTQN